MSMKLAVTMFATLSFSAASLVPLTARAADVTVSIGWQAPPPLIIVSPGVQVVQDYDDEVFFIDGYYWVERDGGWYHSRDHHGNWVFVERSHVHSWLVQPRARGQYKHWNKEKNDAHHAKSSSGSSSKSSNGAKSSNGGSKSKGGKGGGKGGKK